MKFASCLAVALVGLLALSSGCTEPVVEPPAPKPMRLVALTPTTLSGVAGTEVTPTPEVRVLDENGAPAAGALVTFDVTSGGGSIAGAAVTSDASGTARAGAWTLAPNVGTNVLRARLSEPLAESIEFTATGRAGSIASIARASGDGQHGVLGEPLSFPLAVIVADAFGNPIAGAAVTFVVTAGGGTIDSTASTNDAGIATSGSWTLGPTSTEQRVTAKAETAQVEFSATGRVPCTTACPARRQLAFVRSGDIYVANEDGSDLVRLTSGGMFGDPAWSPDGRQIAAVRGSSIYLINADGSGLRLFAAGWSPAWSPDGRRIAFSGRQALESDIFLQSVENEGEPPIRIGFTRGYIDGLTWSPDGSRIAFVSDWAAFDIAFEIYVVNADGSNVVQITHGLRDSGASWPTWTIYAQPAWSPDGRRLAVVACEEWQFYSCERSSVGVMDADGMGFRLLAQTTGFAKPSWAPDGSAVMFSRTCWEYRCASNLFEVAVDGGNERVVIANGHSGAWRP